MTREEILENLVEEFYEDFNECERAQHLLDCEYCELYKKYGRCHLGEYITDYQMPIIKKAQADLLKEFVEWEYARYEGQGLVMFADDFAFAIKKDLEEFLEENKNVEPKESI